MASLPLAVSTGWRAAWQLGALKRGRSDAARRLADSDKARPRDDVLFNVDEVG